MNKKRLALFSIAVVISLFLTSFASAQNIVDDVKKFWQGFIEVLNVILGPILGTSVVSGQAQGDIFFAKLFIFLIILAVVWAVLDAIPPFNEYVWIIAVLSIGVSLLSTRFLATPGWVETILLPYNAFAVTLTAFLPLLLYFYFVEKTIGPRPTLRKTAWIFAAVVFIGLFVSRYEEIGTIAGAGKFNPVWIYIVTSGICFVFFIFDGTIRRAFVKSEMEAIGAADRTALSAELRRKINQANTDLANGVITATQHRRMLKEFNRRLRRVESF
ncbi:hypothetical protein HYV49_05485 [Candidatus Pacearchaeota archaeon]|nr:hypothetical protein [Candidatus Pacearchaeota archaeon]